MNRKNLVILILIIFLVGIGYAFYRYIEFSKKFATTDAMFIRSDRITTLSFKRVQGKIIKLYVKEGDFVKKGQLLAQIDPVDYEISLDEVIFNEKSLENKISQLKIEKNRINLILNTQLLSAQKNIEYLKDKLNEIKAKISEVSVIISQIKRDYNRYKNLYERKAVPKRKYEEIETKLKSYLKKKKALIFEKNSLEKRIEIAKLNLKQIKLNFKKIDEISKQISSLNANLKSLKYKEQDLRNSIRYCNLYAPFSGKIGKKYAEVGMNVKSGYPIYSLVDTNSLYVEVLLEETKLKGVKIGAKAYFHVDAYPKIEFKGIVEKIYPASAATYALVPRDISAGEFTKVAQRIIVRVKITDGPENLLISGMGGEIKIERILNE